jgi:hypothetical protein
MELDSPHLFAVERALEVGGDIFRAWADVTAGSSGPQRACQQAIDCLVLLPCHISSRALLIQ